MEENKTKVLVKLNENNVITQINSSIFVQDIEDWVVIDEGNGDRFSHAQGNYLPKGLMDNNGKYNYKLGTELTELIELSDEEKELLFPTPAPQPTNDDILNILLGVK